MPNETENADRKKEDLQVDYQYVIAGYQRQITALSNDLALKDAAVEMLREENATLRRRVDELASSIPKDSEKVAPTSRTNGKRKV